MSNSVGEILSNHVGLRHGYQFRETDFTESGIQVIKIGNVTDDGLNLEADVSFVSADRISEFENIIIKDGDILMSLTGNIGRVVEVKGLNGKVLFQNYRVGVFYPLDDKVYKPFIKWIFSSENILRQLSNHSNQSAQANFGKQDLDKLRFNLPEFSRQKHIAKILSTADAVIEKTQASIAKYKAIKQGMLQDLFTRGIDLQTGKLRPRYEDAPELYKESKLGWIPREWDDKELGDVGEVRMCRRVFNYETSDQGDIPFYKIGTFGKLPDAYISKEQYDSYRQQFSFPNKGDILISAAGTIGRTIIYDGTPSYFQDSNIVWIQNSGDLISNEYLYQVFQIVEYKTEGGTIQRLYNSILKSALFPCPSKTEQKLITERLQAIDDKLHTEQTYLQKMQSLKKGLMEDLLSGRKQVTLSTEIKEIA